MARAARPTGLQNSHLDEEALRRACLRDPLDPSPIAALGFAALGRGALVDAERCFHDALRRAPEHTAAGVGQALVDYVRHGRRSSPLACTAPGALADLGVPARFAEAFAGLSAEPKVVPDERRPPPRSFLRFAARNLTAACRLDRLRRIPVAPSPGRGPLFEHLHAILRTSGERCPILLGAPSVDLDALCGGLVASLADCASPLDLWELGGFGEPTTDAACDALVATLRSAAATGHRLIVRSLPSLFDGLTPARACGLLRTGALVVLASADLLERMLAALPVLRHVLREIPVSSLSAPETLRACTAERRVIERWLGRKLFRAHLRQSIALADHFLLDTALPEAAIALLGEARPALDAAPITRRALSDAAARLARLPAATVDAGLPLDPARFGQRLHARLRCQRAACDAIARSLAATRALREVQGRSDRPDGAFLLIGPAGSGKRSLAGALTAQLYGDGRILSIDLSLHGRHPGQLFRLAADGPGLLEGSLRARPFSVVLLEHADRAAPEVLALIAAALDTGRLGSEPAVLSLRRTVFIFAVDEAAPRAIAGFHHGEPPREVLAELGRRLFPESPTLLETVTVVACPALDDEELVEAVRERIERGVVEPLRRTRGLSVAVDEAAVREIAARVRSVSLAGGRIDEVIDQLVLAPLWPRLESIGRRIRLVDTGGSPAWEIDLRPGDRKESEQ